MSSIFDAKGGRLLVGGHIALQAGLSLQEVVADGFEFVREIDLKTGLKFRTTTSQVLADHAVCLAIKFEDDVLKGVNFAFNEYITGDMERDSESMFLLHSEFLTQELGMPDKQSTLEQSYHFPWGAIGSLKDVRSCTSYIYVSWMQGG